MQEEAVGPWRGIGLWLTLFAVGVLAAAGALGIVFWVSASPFVSVEFLDSAGAAPFWILVSLPLAAIVVFSALAVWSLLDARSSRRLGVAGALVLWFATGVCGLSIFMGTTGPDDSTGFGLAFLLLLAMGGLSVAISAASSLLGLAFWSWRTDARGHEHASLKPEAAGQGVAGTPQ